MRACVDAVSFGYRHALRVSSDPMRKPFLDDSGMADADPPAPLKVGGLAGLFAHYAKSEPVTLEKMDEAIHAGAAERSLLGTGAITSLSERGARMSWLEMPLQAVPFVVVDVETTGLVAGRDRVVEIAVVKVVLGQEPELLLDTLVDPGMPLRGTEIHGLGDADVAGAPSFASLSGSLLSLLSNRVVAAHNAHFDWRFLGAQLAIEGAPPLLCTLELLAGLDQGRRYSLADACRRYEIALAAGHTAAADALATACLLERLLRQAHQKGYRTLGDLAQLRPPLSSLGRPPLPAPPLMVNALQLAIKARKAATAKPEAEPSAHRRYLESVLAVVSDLEVDMAEVKRLRQERVALGLGEEAVRAVHARVFHAMIHRYVEERTLDNQEADNLRRLYLCLSALGWAPGEAPARAVMPAG